VKPRGAGRHALLVVLAAPIAALAHHSISGVYDSGRQLTIEGRVVEFQFVNPHPILIVAPVPAPGAPASADADSSPWRLEMDNRYELADIGVTAKTFKPGEHVIATGSAARDESRSLYLMKLDRPADGLRYEQIGYSPHITAGKP
jgi:uncharacterized protein DUF6152